MRVDVTMDADALEGFQVAANRYIVIPSTASAGCLPNKAVPSRLHVMNLDEQRSSHIVFCLGLRCLNYDWGNVTIR